MKKVVYNTDFGGFSISKECAEWLANRGNKECLNMLVAHGAACDEGVFSSAGSHGYLSETPRHDALLVMAVEELGERAGSALAVHTLRGNRYIIDEYDGAETVVEPHTIHWIKV
jgi:hypothetical protein